MNAATDIKPVSALRARPVELIEQSRDTGHPILITQNGEATAVLQDVQSYERQRRALHLLRFAVQGDKDYRSGNKIAHGQLKKQFQQKFAAMREVCEQAVQD